MNLHCNPQCAISLKLAVEYRIVHLYLILTVVFLGTEEALRNNSLLSGGGRLADKDGVVSYRRA